MRERTSVRRAHLLGIGLDHTDGHQRITRAEKFSVLGGSEETHTRATETLIRTCEDLQRRGRELEEAEPKELAELIHKHSTR